ncbi:inactive tyrosine-protein kinase PRAG1 [Polymixia lowei]
MEPSTASRTERQTGPPVLPVKQRRSQYSRSSSVDLESDGDMFSPLGPQHQNHTYSDVFSEAADCHAAQCPIHQRYDASHCHQERFFSDGTPPPIPKKRLARTLSLPVADIPPPSPLFHVSPLQFHRSPRNFDNPLYMLAPIADTPHTHKERDEVKPVKRNLGPLLCLSQLSFDTPDEQLPYFFSSFSDHGVVSQGIQHCHLLCLKSMAQSVEAGILLQGETGESDVEPYQPQDFLLCEGYKPRLIGDALYYSLNSPRFPRRVLGARVHKLVNPTPSADATTRPSHVNLQEVIVHFPPGSTLNSDSITRLTENSVLASAPSQPDCTAVKPSCGGSNESVQSQSNVMNINLPTVLSLIQKGFSVSVERDLPQATLEDFIQDSRSLQSSDPLLYERQLCVLFLQLMMGLRHLYSNEAPGVELKPQDIFLVWPRRQITEEEVMNEQEQDRTGSSTDTSKAEKHNSVTEELVQGERQRGVHVLWGKWGSPRLVLGHHHPYPSPSHTPPSINTQIGALLQHCLQPGDGLTSFIQGSITNLTSSPYKSGLLNLASWLQEGASGLEMADTVAMLQVLLWGPRAQLFQLNYVDLNITTVNNWLSIKRALLVMKLAERGLVQDQSILDWEDCLCLQYLSFCDCKTVMRAVERLGIILSIGNV